MKIGFDISQIAHGGGVSNYTDNLAHQLLENKELEMTFFYSLLRKSYRGDLPNVKSYKIPPTLLEVMFNKIRFPPIDWFIGNVDVYHSSDWTQPKTVAKTVTTYHDLISLKFPRWSHPKIVEVHKRRLKIVKKEVDKIIAVSEATKKDLIEVANIAENRIIVIYEGIASNFKPQTEIDMVEFKRKWNLPENYVLAVGGVGERKNLPRIKEAAKDFNLVILGETVKNISQKELPLLYSGADLLVYTTLYEGFGLPILEAMASGTPVITSNVSSMPEVGGKAALYIDPEDVDQIKDKIKEVLHDKRLTQEMIKEGIKQASKFSWEKCAEQTINVYRKVLRA